MDPAEPVLDGNAIGGLLATLFGTDVTSAERVCATCGATHTIGSHRLYRGAGAILRCPTCDDIAAIIVEADAHVALTITGTWRLPR